MKFRADMLRAFARLTGDAASRFIAGWVAMQAQLMADSGKGYARGSMRHSGRGTDRRADKFDSKGRPLTKLQRAAAGGHIGKSHRGLNPMAKAKGRKHDAR